MTDKRAYLHELSCARGVAAWMVVLFHARLGMPWLPDGVMAVLDKGYLAVDFFFLLSGFVIYLSAREALARDGIRAVPVFWRRRMARIWPLYAVMLALTTAFAALLTLTGREDGGYPWSELPLHILMVQNWGFTDALSWNHPAWSISTEMAAYLLFPLLVLGLPLARMPRPGLLAGMATLIAIMAAWLHYAGLRDLGENIPHYGLVRCLFEFTAGCLLCAAWLRGTGGRTEKAPAAAALLIAGGAAAIWPTRPTAELWAFPAIAGSVIFLLAELSRRTPPTRNWPAPLRVLVYLGDISYATYLSHFMLFIWFKIALVDDASNIPPMTMALFLMLTLAVSALLYHLVEKPGRRLFVQAASGTSGSGAAVDWARRSAR